MMFTEKNSGRRKSCQHNRDGQPALLFQDGPRHVDDHIKDDRCHTGQHTGHCHAHILVGAERLIERGDDGDDNQRWQRRAHHSNQCAGDACYMVAHQNRGVDGNRSGA